LIDLIKFLHGSYISKQKAIEDFYALYPACSKKQIEKKINSLFVKEKPENEPKPRWMASEATLTEHQLVGNEELKTLASSRLQECLDELQKVQDELNMKLQLKKDLKDKEKEEQRAVKEQKKL
jgi:hypothetical protein